MSKAEILESLRSFRDRLEHDVLKAYTNRGASFGGERYATWRRQFSKFLDENYPGMSAKLDVSLQKVAMYRGYEESDVSVFLREDAEPCAAFIDSLLIDIEIDEVEATQIHKNPESSSSPPAKRNKKRVFIVHGHDDLIKIKTARFVEKLGLEAIILHEQPSKGMTIIEKIEAYADVGFAIILYTPDDRGNALDAADKGTLNARARQNVVFEHGYLIAKLGRQRVVPLVSGKVEFPSDINGVVYVDDSNWQIEIAKEMKSAGYAVDFNKLL